MLDKSLDNSREVVSAMSSYQHLSWVVEEGIVTVTMNRPPVNAVNQEMYRELAAAFAADGPIAGSAKVVVLVGAGRHFCAGNDLVEFGTLTPGNSDARMAEVRAAFFAIHDCPIPVIGAVRGAAVGTGLAIAASCDFVIAADDARFGTPEVGVGVMGGARHLARLVPEPWVRWMYFTAEPVAAQQLLRLGSLIAVVPAAELLEAAREHAGLVSRHSSVILRMAKHALNHVETMDLQSGYIFEQGLTGELSGTPDSSEARAATLGHRAPRYPSESQGRSPTGGSCVLLPGPHTSPD
jgi:enoyl-CoA hydratase